MDLNTNPKSTEDPNSNQTPAAPRRRRVGAIIGAGLLAGLVAAGIGGVASAQSVQVEDVLQPAVIAQDDAEQPDDVGPEHDLGEGDLEEYPELSGEDDAVFDRFDACLRDAGVDFDATDEAHEAGTLDDTHEIDEDALDAAFESCEPILDDLSIDLDIIEGEFGDDFEGDFGDGLELSPQDEALFEQFDVCLDNAVDFDALADAYDAGTVTEADEAAVDAAFESCEPILDNLSEDAQLFFGEDCPEDHEADEAGSDEVPDA